MPILGSSVGDPNFRLRFFIIIFMGVMAFGSVLYWKSQLMLTTQYVDIPTQAPVHKTDTNKTTPKFNKLKSQNYGE